MNIFEDMKTIYGYEVDNDILNINNELINFMYSLSQENFDSYKVANITKAVFTTDVKSFFESQLKLRDVLCVEEIDIFKLQGRRVKSLDMLITLYNQLGKRTNPFDIPLKFEGVDNFYGVTELQIPICEEEEFLKRMNIYFNRIALSINITPIIGACYTHELTHTQLVVNRGIIKDFYNMELLPIFMELLYAYKIDPSLRLFKTVLKYRINHLLYSFDDIFNYYETSEKTEKNKINAMFSSKYITSIFKAIKLLNKYIYGTQELRIEIMEWIQQVFDELRCLEDMLEHFDISYDNSMNLEMILNMKKIH